MPTNEHHVLVCIGLVDVDVDEPETGVVDQASVAKSRSGLATAITGCPAPTSESMTLSQLADSANAPWTRTIVGFMRSSSESRGSFTWPTA
jgi:hypothetical protein